MLSQPIDINELRADRGGNPDFWRENQRRRFQDPALVDQVLALDEVGAGKRGDGLPWGLLPFSRLTRHGSEQPHSPHAPSARKVALPHPLWHSMVFLFATPCLRMCEGAPLEHAWGTPGAGCGF